jgi:hypothetical protein
MHRELRLIVTVSVLWALPGCDQVSGPHAVTESVYAHIPNAAVLTFAFPEPNGSAAAELYGVFSTLNACNAARKVYVELKPQKYSVRGVDFAYIIDSYNPTEKQTADNAAMQ